MTPPLPASVRVLGRPYTIESAPVEEMGGAAGLCYRAEGLIQIREDQPVFDETDTVIHEVMHAILYCQGRPCGGKVEETYVRALATGLTGVLTDNPHFLKWLVQRIAIHPK